MAEPATLEKEVDDFQEIVYDEAPRPAEEEVVTPADAVAPVEPVVPVPPEPIKPTHSTELIAKAVRLDISEEEMGSMTSVELQRTISLMNKFGQRVYDQTVQQRTPETSKVVAPVEEVDPFKDLEGKWEPELLAPIKATFAENKALKERLDRLEQGQNLSRGNEVRRRLEPMLSEISPELVGVFKDAGEWSELMSSMSAVAGMEQRTQKELTEPDRLRRAIAMLGKTVKPAVVDTAEVEKKAAFEKWKLEYDAAALGTPTNRKPPAKIVDIVNEKIKKIRSKEQSATELIEEKFEPFEG